MQFLDIDQHDRINLFKSHESIFRDGSLPFDNVFKTDVVINLGYPSKFSSNKFKSKFYKKFNDNIVINSINIYISERYLRRDQAETVFIIEPSEFNANVIDKISDVFQNSPHDGTIFSKDGGWGIAIDHFVGFVWLGLRSSNYRALMREDAIHKEMIESDLRDVEDILPQQIARVVPGYGDRLR